MLLQPLDAEQLLDDRFIDDGLRANPLTTLARRLGKVSPDPLAPLMTPPGRPCSPILPTYIPRVES